MILRTLETITTMDLPEDRLVVAGDWHGDRSFMGRAIPAAARTGVRTIVHVGALGIWPGETESLLATLDYWIARSWEDHATGIERLILCPGNHEDWAELDGLFSSSPGLAVRVSECVWIMPRGFRLRAGGRTITAFGGAASIDLEYRVPFRTWWPTEMPTTEEVENAIRDGPTEVLITHDAGTLVTPRVEKILSGPSGWSESALRYAEMGQRRIGDLVAGVTPRLHVHGHFHLRDSAVIDRDGLPPLQIESLAMNDQPGNLAIVDMRDLSVREVEVPR